jgi:type IV pilus assembly protein PilA
MVKRARARANSEPGFTLVELLVVMLILGIIAAIAIPAFLNQRDKANDAGAKSIVRSMQTAEEACNSDKGGGTYTGCDLAGLNKVEPSIPASDPNLTATPNGSTGYTVTAKSSSASQTVFTITRTNGLVVRSCDTPNKGGCQQKGTSTSPPGTW